MYYEFFSKSPLLALPLLSLVLFTLVFAAVVFRTFGKRAQETANEASLLPLQDDERSEDGHE